MLEAKQSGNVVEDFTIGNTRIKICADFCRTRTSGEVKDVYKRQDRAWNPLSKTEKLPAIGQKSCWRKQPMKNGSMALLPKLSADLFVQ